MKFKLIFLGIFISQVHWSNSQNRPISSLKYQLSQPIHDTTKGKLLLELSDFYFSEKKVDSSILLIKNALIIFQKYDNSNWLIKSYNRLGSKMLLEKKVIEAKSYYNKALEIAKSKEDFYGQMRVYNHFGYFYQEINDWNNSLLYYHKALTLAKKINNEDDISEIKNLIMEVYISKGAYKTALKIYNELQKYYISHENEDNYPFYLSAGANIYHHLNLKYLEEETLLKAHHIAHKNQWSQKNTSLSLGIFYSDAEQFKKAEYFLKKSLQLSFQYKSLEDIANAYSYLERLYYLKNDKKNGDKYKFLMRKLSDSVNLSESLKKLAEYEVRYKTAEKEKQLAESKLEIAQNRNWIIGLGLAFFSLVGFGLLFWKIQVNKQKAVLQAIEVENTRKVLNASEIERQRIAKELHDSVGSHLTVVSSSLDNAFFLAINQKLIPQKIDSISTDVREVAQSLRDTIWATHNTVIPISNLYARMQHHLAKVLDDKPTIKHCSILIGTDRELNSMEALNFFRIFQESVQNIQKHAHASIINLSLENVDNQLKLTISDNGKGFDINTENRYENFGLANMRLRCHEMKALLSINSELNKGTTIEVLLNKTDL